MATKTFPHRSNRSGDLRPYFFQRDSSDVLEEVVGELLQQRRQGPPPASGPQSGEQAVLREQHWTLFEYDDAMQRLFSGDFDAFCAAMDNPKKMHEYIRERFRRLDHDRRASSVQNAETRQKSKWDDRAASVRRWESTLAPGPTEDAPCADCGNVHAADGAERPASLDDDPIYNAAFRWACRTDRWSRRLYVGQGIRDRDLFRVFVNAALVPAKIAFGFTGTLGDDLASLEVGAMGYRQAAIFLTRTMESLANCHAKRVHRAQTAHVLLDEGRELLADVESKLAEIESDIRYHRGDKG